MPSDAIGGHRRPSEVIGGHRRPSDAIGRHWTPSEVIGRHRTPSDAVSSVCPPQDNSSQTRLESCPRCGLHKAQKPPQSTLFHQIGVSLPWKSPTDPSAILQLLKGCVWFSILYTRDQPRLIPALAMLCVRKHSSQATSA